MTAIDGLTLLVYIVVIFLIWRVWKKEFFSSLFKPDKRLSWIIGSVSMFMYLMSPQVLALNSEVLRNNGFKGFWIFWSQWMAAGFVPLIFAPLWNRFQLQTDNEFILKRFSGAGAKALFYFRASFLGFFITPIIVSFQLLVFSEFLQHFWGISYEFALSISSVCIILSSLKNSVRINLRTDFFHGFLYVVAIMLLFSMLLLKVGSIASAMQILEQRQPGMSSLFPQMTDQKSWNALFVLFGIQWWSLALFDGGGVEMQRFNTAKTPSKALYIALGGLLLSQVFTLLNLSITVLAEASAVRQVSIFATVRELIPDSLRMLLTLGIWAAFITTAESMVNWGSSFVVVNIGGQFGWSDSSRKAAIGSLIFVVLLTAIAVVFAWYNRSLSTFFFWFLSFSAGVAPVFFLRWFWYRINAWAQLSAMLGAALYTIVYDHLEPSLASYLRYDLLDPYYWKLIIMTVVNMLTWITVMYLTPADDPRHIKEFRSAIPDRKWLVRRGGIALVVGVLVVSVYAFLVFLLFRT